MDPTASALQSILSELASIKEQQQDHHRWVRERLAKLEGAVFHHDGSRRSAIHDPWHLGGGTPDVLAFAAPISSALNSPSRHHTRAMPHLDTGRSSDGFLIRAAYPSEGGTLGTGMPEDSSQQQQQQQQQGRQPGGSSLGMADIAEDASGATGTSGSQDPGLTHTLGLNSKPGVLRGPTPTTPNAAEATAATRESMLETRCSRVEDLEPWGYREGEPLLIRPPLLNAGGRPSYDDVEEEEEVDGTPHSRAKAIRKWLWGVIMPEERTFWDIFILISMLWVCFGSTVIICFDLGASWQHNKALAAIELAVDLLFAADMWINFRSCFYDMNGKLVTKRSSIAGHYLRSWFIIDLLSVFPFDLFLNSSIGFITLFKVARVARIAKLLRLLRVYKLVRLVRMPRLLRILESHMDNAHLAIALFVLAVVTTVHISACLFYFMASLEPPGTPTWVTAAGIQALPLPQQYLTSIYWSITTVSTTGYGDVYPVTGRERLVSIGLMFIGVSLLGYITSSIANMMSVRNSTNTRIAAKRQRVSDWLKGRCVSKQLVARVNTFYSYAATKEAVREEAALIGELPLRLKTKVLAQLYADVVHGVPAFSDAHPDFLAQLVCCLEPEYYGKGDVVVMQGDAVDSIFFVKEGPLEVRQYEFDSNADPSCSWSLACSSEELTAHLYLLYGILKPNAHFGMHSCTVQGQWPATVVSREGSELLRLPRDILQELLSAWPSVGDAFSASTSALIRQLTPPSDDGTGPPSYQEVTGRTAALVAADFPMIEQLKIKAQSKLSVFTASAGHIARSMMRRGVQSFAHRAGRSDGGTATNTATSPDPDAQGQVGAGSTSSTTRQQNGSDGIGIGANDLLGALMRKDGVAPGNAPLPAGYRPSQSRKGTVDNVVAGMRTLRNSLSMGMHASTPTAQPGTSLPSRNDNVGNMPGSSSRSGGPGWRADSLGNVSEAPSRFLSRTDSNASRRASSMGGAAPLPASPVDFLDGLVSFSVREGGPHSDGGASRGGGQYANGGGGVGAVLSPQGLRSSRPTWEDLYSRVRSARQTMEDGGGVRQLPRFVFSAETAGAGNSGAAAGAGVGVGGVVDAAQAGGQPPRVPVRQQSVARGGPGGGMPCTSGMGLGLGETVGPIGSARASRATVELGASGAQPVSAPDMQSQQGQQLPPQASQAADDT